MQFKINQLSDLFIQADELNTNLHDVQRRCEEFAVQGGEFMESTINAVRGGNTLAGPETLGAQGNTVSAEMLSPD